MGGSAKFNNEGLKNEIKKAANVDLSFFIYESANETIRRAKKMKNPEKLFGELFIEGEICVLFSDSNIGKTVLAYNVADSISRGEDFLGQKCTAPPQEVAYFDFELSEKQFEKRYSEDFNSHYQFSDNLKRVSINYDYLGEDDDITKQVYNSIIKCVEDRGVRVLVIDNLTYIGDKLEESKNAIPLLKKLKALKQKHNLSLLVIAHTPKRDMTRPITQNDLGGSKHISNFKDASFAIGQSTSGESYRYIKQIKVRNGAKEFHENNVLVCQVVQKDSHTTFEYAGTSTEQEHLKSRNNDSYVKELKEKAKELHKNGLSYQQIADEIGVAKSTVSKYVKE